MPDASECLPARDLPSNVHIPAAPGNSVLHSNAPLSCLSQTDPSAMADTERPTPSITITPMSTAKQVREELCRATGQQVWSNNQYWSFYLAVPARSPSLHITPSNTSEYRRAAARYSTIFMTRSPTRIGKTRPYPSWSSRST